MDRHLALDNEDLGEVANLSGRGTWAVLDLFEILHGLVEALPPLHTVPKCHEGRMTTS